MMAFEKELKNPSNGTASSGPLKRDIPWVVQLPDGDSAVVDDDLIQVLSIPKAS